MKAPHIMQRHVSYMSNKETRDNRRSVTVFLPMMDILSCQLINYFEEMKLVVTSYQVSEPSFLSNTSHLVLEVEAKNFSNKFPNNVFPLLSSQMLSIKMSFREKLSCTLGLPVEKLA